MIEIRASEIKCEHCPVRKNGICSYLSADELKEIEDNRTLLLYGNTNDVLSSKEVQPFFGNIISGSALVSHGHTSEDVKARKIALSSHLIIKDKPREGFYKISSCGEILVCSIDIQFYQKHFESFPSITRGVAEILSRELSHEIRRNSITRDMSSEDKVRNYLAFLCKNYSRNIDDILLLHLPISRRKSAELLGMTPETLSREISKLKKDNIIKTLGHKYITIKFASNIDLTAEDLFLGICTVI